MPDALLDRLARSLAGGLPRRAMFAGLLTGALPGLGLAAQPAAAACKKVGKKCDKNSDCCAKAKCKNDKCRCKSGFTNCDGTCKNLDNDEQHCGRCNARCADGER